MCYRNMYYLQTEISANVVIFIAVLFSVSHSVNAAFYKLDGVIPNQTELVRWLLKCEDISSNVVADVMSKVDRKYYLKITPYGYFAEEIGYNARICPPYTHGYILEKLEDHLKEGYKVLDVGSGSGYLTACFALMVGKTGQAIGIDHIPQLVNLSRENVFQDNPELITSGRVKFVCGDGRLGVPEEAPFDVIHVSGAVPIIPEPLVNQLKKGGWMMIPRGGTASDQELLLVKKELNGTLTEEVLKYLTTVDLTDKEKQWPKDAEEPKTIRPKKKHELMG